MPEFERKIESEIKKEKILPREIRDGLNEIRSKNIPFYEKAQQLASLLQKTDCKDVEVLDCDVCVTDFYPEFYEKFHEIWPENFNELSKEEQQHVIKKIDEQIPQKAKVRVHGQTSSGYFTWCFGCEGTMCMNEVEYPEDPNWDKIHEERVREILLQFPEWKITKFQLSGCTRNRINIDVISSDSEFKVHSFDQDELHISISSMSPGILKYRPELEKYFNPLR